MDNSRLKKHIAAYKKWVTANPATFQEECTDRKDRVHYYQSWTKDKLLTIDADGLTDYLSRLFAMLVWGNKRYVVDKLLSEQTLKSVQDELASLVWGEESIDKRWDRFRKKIKGIGPAMLSEILCYVYPDQYMIWNRKAYTGFKALNFKGLPRHTYQLTGAKYAELCGYAETIARELRDAGIQDVDMLSVDYFVWRVLQTEDDPPDNGNGEGGDQPEVPPTFIHNDIRDKIADIGKWLGFTTQIEAKVAAGSKVDAIWEATIGNMGRVIYVFEVQTKGSTDSLIINLFKALNNPAVQGVVAVSDAKQLDTIKKHAENVGDLHKKLKYWDFSEVLKNHEALEAVNESINSLGLVPQGF